MRSHFQVIRSKDEQDLSRQVHRLLVKGYTQAQISRIVLEAMGLVDYYQLQKQREHKATG